jgi:hypothetical protein
MILSKNSKLTVGYLLAFVVVVGGIWLMKHPISSLAQLDSEKPWKTFDAGDFTIQLPPDWTASFADSQIQIYAPGTTTWPLRIDFREARIQDAIAQLNEMLARENGKMESGGNITVGGEEGIQVKYTLPPLAALGKEAGFETYVVHNGTLYTISWEASSGEACWEKCPKILSTLKFK